MGVHDHHIEAKKIGPIRYVRLSITDSRKSEDDHSGRLIESLFNEAGHCQVASMILKNDPKGLREVVKKLCEEEVDLIVMTGGTGLGKKDHTIEAISPVLDKVLPGFGELFRSLSFQEVGSAALMSRALCGMAKGKVIVCLPGSEHAVRLALTKLLIPEAQHLVWQAAR
ncbi:MAG: molybdenum cofactor biosynthesis protein MoaB [candidate division NC10 bacterium]|nr:molybdenum cofactor biosynthesis protein MoaB [candidate division NC10 bacterium]MDE2320884.1 molybdenum cofactor biosynthesis protein MoaB [candidate division NC10 bacterium]